MHTLKDIKSEDFEVELDRKNSSWNELFPDFNHRDRLGIITRSEGGVLGASLILMAAISEFYHVYRGGNLGNQTGKLRIYPEHFIFHIGNLLGHYGQLDIWPPHREVVVEDDSEQILEAINDRGITRLLIEEGPTTSATLLRESISSAESRIASLLYYSPNGKVQNGDVVVKNNGSISPFVLKAYEDCLSALRDKEHVKIKYPKEKLAKSVPVTQTFKRIDLETGIKSLSHSKKISDKTKLFIEKSAPGAAITL